VEHIFASIRRNDVRSLGIFIKAGLALCLIGSVALADTVKYAADLEPDTQGGAGKGTATITVDTTAKTLTYSIEFSGLTAPPAMAAFLSPPAQANGTPGTMPIKLPLNPASPVTGTMPLTAAQITGIKGGQWLLLIGSQKAPEIGGEVKPAQ
jgi:hypothetical protein